MFLRYCLPQRLWIIQSRVIQESPLQSAVWNQHGPHVQGYLARKKQPPPLGPP